MQRRADEVQEKKKREWQGKGDDPRCAEILNTFFFPWNNLFIFAGRYRRRLFSRAMTKHDTREGGEVRECMASPGKGKKGSLCPGKVTESSLSSLPGIETVPLNYTTPFSALTRPAWKKGHGKAASWVAQGRSLPVRACLVFDPFDGLCFAVRPESSRGCVHSGASVCHRGRRK